MEEEVKEVREALKVSESSHTPENIKALQTEIGDCLFALICLANKKHIKLEDCLNLATEKNIELSSQKEENVLSELNILKTMETKQKEIKELLNI